MNVRLVCALGLVLGACAQGAEGTDPDPWAADGANGTAEDAGATDSAITPPGDGSDGAGDGTNGDADPSPEHDAGAPGDGSAGDGSAGDGSSGDGSAGDGDDGDPEPQCPAARGCNGALLMSDFLGDDENQATVSASGSGSEWLTIQVKEDSFGLTGLSVRFELRGQADADYDLYVYEGCDDSSPDANVSVGSSAEQVTLSWSDTPLLVDDSKQLTLEVRHVSGACSAWTLDAVKP